MIKKMKFLTQSSAIAILASSPLVAHAQDGGGLDEVIVTATKTGAKNLQVVPIAVTALNTDALDKGVVIDIQGVNLTLGNHRFLFGVLVQMTMEPGVINPLVYLLMKSF